MTDEQIAAIRARLEKITPSPWKVRDGDPKEDNEVVNVRGLTIYGPRAAVSCGAEADFIAHAPDDLRALLDQHDVDQVRIAALEGALQEIFASSLVRNSWDGSCAVCGEWHGHESGMDKQCVLGRARAALKGDDQP